MRAEHREAMWELYLAYEARLTQAGASDFNDLLLRATSVVDRLSELFRYSAVILDEVQDLNLSAVRFLANLARNHTERLLFIGDGQQSVYPGGFTLSEAGISVTGRAAVLSHNYRNTPRCSTKPVGWSAPTLSTISKASQTSVHPRPSRHGTDIAL
jgi:superfamily I DNA/RNA helicase